MKRKTFFFLHCSRQFKFFSFKKNLFYSSTDEERKKKVAIEKTKFIDHLKLLGVEKKFSSIIFTLKWVPLAKK